MIIAINVGNIGTLTDHNRSVKMSAIKNLINCPVNDSPIPSIVGRDSIEDMSPMQRTPSDHLAYLERAGYAQLNVTLRGRQPPYSAGRTQRTKHEREADTVSCLVIEETSLPSNNHCDAFACVPYVCMPAHTHTTRQST